MIRLIGKLCDKSQECMMWGCKLLNGGIKSMYVNSLAFFRVQGGESEQFREVG